MLLFALEAHLGVNIQLNHPVISWIVSHAGYIATHYMIKSDGRTPYEKLKGKETKKEMCEIGEKVHYMPLKGKHGRASLDQRFDIGIWLGINERNSEVFVATADGNMVGARSIKRMAPDQCWDKDMVQAIKGVPWNLVGTEERVELAFEQELLVLLGREARPY